jgi:hypothetical protein
MHSRVTTESAEGGLVTSPVPLGTEFKVSKLRGGTKGQPQLYNGQA